MTSARRWATVGSSEVNQAEHDDALPVGYGGVDEQSGTAAVVDGPVVGVGVVVLGVSGWVSAQFQEARVDLVSCLLG